MEWAVESQTVSCFMSSPITSVHPRHVPVQEPVAHQGPERNELPTGPGLGGHPVPIMLTPTAACSLETGLGQLRSESNNPVINCPAPTTFIRPWYFQYV